MTKKVFDQNGFGQVLLSVRMELSALWRAIKEHGAGTETGAMVRVATPAEQFTVADGISGSLDGVKKMEFVGSGMGISDSVECFINGEAV
jgi:hypothetical protein